MRAAKPFYLAVLGLTLSGILRCHKALPRLCRPDRPCRPRPTLMPAHSAACADGRERSGVVTVQAAPAGEVSV